MHVASCGFKQVRRTTRSVGVTSIIPISAILLATKMRKNKLLHLNLVTRLASPIG
jgi:hypothetical protein